MAFNYALPLHIAQALIDIIILGLIAYGKQNRNNTRIEV
jgi:hypothetical protein